MADGILLTHGAVFNKDAPLLLGLDKALSGLGLTVERYNLPYRQKAVDGPPPAGSMPEDLEGLRAAVTAMRERVDGRLFLGGQSYGGLLATLLAAEDAALVDGLMLFPYPLHPPGGAMNTEHLTSLDTPALFVHGTGDPRGSIEEMRAALKVIPAKTELVAVDGEGHQLNPARVVEPAVAAFRRFYLS